MIEAPTLKASGDINPCRFITVSGQMTVAESNAGNVPLGISGESTRDAPLPSGQSTLHAKSGDPVVKHMVGSVCLLEAGTGGMTANNLLKPDADGKGINSAAGDLVGALALETVAAGVKGRVLVLSPGSQQT